MFADAGIGFFVFRHSAGDIRNFLDDATDLTAIEYATALSNHALFICEK